MFPIKCEFEEITKTHQTQNQSHSPWCFNRNKSIRLYHQFKGSNRRIKSIKTRKQGDPDESERGYKRIQYSSEIQRLTEVAEAGVEGNNRVGRRRIKS